MLLGMRSGLRGTPPSPAAPVNTVAPVISGTAWEGQTLSASQGSWTGYPAPTYGYAWNRAGVAISGATSSTYQLVAADTGNAITCTVTATNSEGSASATSGSVSAITPPLITATPAASTYYVSEGDSITAGGGSQGTTYNALFAGTDTTNITFSNQGVSGNKLQDLVDRASTVDALIGSNPDKTNYILSVLVGTNEITNGTVIYYPNDAAGFLTAYRTYLAARKAAGWDVTVFTILPRNNSSYDAWINTVNTGILGFVASGHADAVVDLYNAPVVGGFASSANTAFYYDGLHPTPLGHRYIERAVAAALSARMTAAIAPTIASAAITGTAQENNVLTAVAGATTGHGTPTKSYQWKRSGTNISGATSQTYSLVTADVGSTITVVITVTNAGGSASATSSATATITAAPVSAPVNTVVPAITGTAQDGQTLTASTGTWSNTPTGYAYQWKRAGTNISGAIASTYACVTADVGSTLTVTVTASNAGGSASATSVATGAVVSATPLSWNAADKSSSITLTNSDRDATPNTGGMATIRATGSKSSGKWYVEYTTTAVALTNPSLGLGLATAGATLTNYLGSGSGGACLWMHGDGPFAASPFAVGSSGAQAAANAYAGAVTAGDVYGLAVDFDNGRVWISKNGVWAGGVNPTSASDPLLTFTAGSALFPAVTENGDTSCTVRLAAAAAYSPPTGYSVWNG